MKPERIAAFTAWWVRRYTRSLPPMIAARRRGEIEADLDDHIEFGRRSGMGEARIALSILSRLVRGARADLSWRAEHAARSHDAATAGGPMMSDTTSYRLALVSALAVAVFLAWSVVAMGLIGAEGDPFDLLYLVLVGVGIVGACLCRLRPDGMARALVSMAGAQALITLFALLLGKQTSPVSSVAEILGLNVMFIALFLASASLFRRASRRPSGYGTGI